MAVTDKTWTKGQPISGVEEITPSSNAFKRTRAIIVNTDGNYTIQFQQGNPVQVTLVQGVIYPFSIIKCTQAAGDIFGLW